MDKLGDRGMTPDSGTEQTRELMPATESNVVPMPLAEGVDGTRSLPALTDERKVQIEAESKRKITFMEREYWALRNDEQEFMRCPFCAHSGDCRLNFVGQPMCCALFAKAFGAILERQAQVDVAAQMVRNCHSVGLVN